MRLNLFPLLITLLMVVSLLAGCSSTSRRSASSSNQTSPVRPASDGPGTEPPPDIAAIPDAVVKAERLIPGPNKPYTVLGQSYVPDTSDRPLSQRGIATWYGRKFHGNRTASGEIYDMYAMSAAHTILPIPSYARVTLLASGKSVVVRINDRGPFVAGRVIDLSYTAAAKLGLLARGSGEVLVERVFPSTSSSPYAATPVVVAIPSEPGGLAAKQVVDKTPEPVEIKSPYMDPKLVNPADAASAGLALQAGAFSQRGNANNLAEKIRKTLPDLAALVQVQEAQGLWRIVIGSFATQAQRNAAAQQIETAIGERVSNARP
jgi:rare lipoprotein A